MKKITKDNAKFIKSIIRVEYKPNQMVFMVESDKWNDPKYVTLTNEVKMSNGFFIDENYKKTHSFCHIETRDFRKLTSTLSKCFDIIDTYFYLLSEGLWCEKAFWEELESRKLAA